MGPQALLVRWGGQGRSGGAGGATHVPPQGGWRRQQVSCVYAWWQICIKIPTGLIRLNYMYGHTEHTQSVTPFCGKGLQGTDVESEAPVQKFARALLVCYVEKKKQKKKKKSL